MGSGLVPGMVARQRTVPPAPADQADEMLAVAVKAYVDELVSEACALGFDRRAVTAAIAGAAVALEAAA